MGRKKGREGERGQRVRKREAKRVKAGFFLNKKTTLEII